ncbi:MAG: hypothetical protein SH850_14455 [Planctomycetaceae bacterium]|nr:hypothetical protein [Planctomycetaceae bacterium]
MQGNVLVVRNVACALVAALGLYAVRPAEAADAKLKGPTVIEGQLTYAANISGDGLAAR